MKKYSVGIDADNFDSALRLLRKRLERNVKRNEYLKVEIKFISVELRGLPTHDGHEMHMEFKFEVTEE